ncbi:MAG: hypothetical protein BJ554DRAFT_4606, partial [Olpidium bornovanus]
QTRSNYGNSLKNAKLAVESAPGFGQTPRDSPKASDKTLYHDTSKNHTGRLPDEGLVPAFHLPVGFRIVGDGELDVHAELSEEFPHRYRVQFPSIFFRCA